MISQTDAKRTEFETPEAVQSLGERISYVATHLGGRATLAKAVDISESQLYRYISGESTPRIETAVAIARAGSVGLEWLATGATSAVDAEAGSGSALHVRIPLYDLTLPDAQQALVAGRATHETLGFPAAWLRSFLGISPDQLMLAITPSDSMEPTVRRGDIVMINQSDRKFADGVHAFLIENRLFIKRLQLRPDGVWATSEKTGHPEFRLPSADNDPASLRLIGRVVWVGHRL